MLHQRKLSRQFDVKARTRGFTLIEVMIVVAVIALLAAVAMPAYFDSIRKSRRADGIAALNRIAQEQERFRANNPNYAPTPAALGVANPSSGYYTLGIAGNTATGYVATATAAGAQASDARCTALSLTMSVGNLAYGSTGTASNNQCWNR